jgi:16S rRNA (guanine527-N7)-methyltransferase
VNASVDIDQSDALARGAQAMGMQLPPEAIARLTQHLALIEKWNAVHNLTAIRDRASMVTHHVLDALTLSAFLPHGVTLLDVGSGAGFPGLTLAIARPDLQVTVLDSNQKKAAFLQQTIGALKIANATSVCARVERWIAPHPFEVIVSRALAELQEFAALSRHLLKPQGRLFAMKGVYPHDEIARLPPSVIVERVEPLVIPGLDATRHLVIMSI